MPALRQKFGLDSGGGTHSVVLSDSINDKLYEIFLDTVMDDTPELVEDYIDDLKEMIHP